MNRRLVILRHAHSSRDDSSLQDHDRPLDSIGLRDAPVMANEVLRRGWKPTHIFVSSSLRTMQTLEHLGSEFYEIPRDVKDELYNAPLHTMLAIVESLTADSTVMIIGHNPGCEMLVESLTGNLEAMPTASASLIYEKDGQWYLEDLIRPRNLI